MGTTVTIRPAEERDAPALTAIYNHYIATTPITFDVEPWTVDARAAWLRAHANTGRYRIVVADAGGEPVGYASTSRFRDKAAYETSVEASVYCHPEARGQGLGRQLYDALFEAVAGEDIHRILAGITLPNERSMRLHTRCGFTQIGVFTDVGRKFGRYWDVAWFERPL